MERVILEISKYAILFCFLLFTITGFQAIGRNKGKLFSVQRFFMFAVHFLMFLVLFIHTKEVKYLAFYGAQALFFAVLFYVYHSVYPNMSKLIINNMCMLLAIGFVMIARIAFARAVKQFIIVAAACIIAMLIPFIIKKIRWLPKPVWLYAAAGIAFLAAMKLAGVITNGASISFTVAGVTIQPVEFVKIIFVFFLAAFLSKRHDFKSIMLVSAVSAVHVLLLVWSKELGGALIFCVVYLSLIYVATHQPLYVLGGLAGGSAAAVAAYHLFNHVRVRVLTWSTPFSKMKQDTSQISQSLFAIGSGGWFGLGLMEGIPHTIPVSCEDMIFSAITEELGLCFSLCLILICLSTFIMFINIATKIKNPFYKLLATGFGVEYIFQVFLTIGGGTKFIPLTGVTLPLVSYGGSSVLCTLVIFHIIQGIYVLRQTEDYADEVYEEDSYNSEAYAREEYDEEEPAGSKNRRYRSAEDEYEEYTEEYGEEEYADNYEEYAEDDYEERESAESDYALEGYAEDEYDTEGYAENEYGTEGYAEEEYEEETGGRNGRYADPAAYQAYRNRQEIASQFDEYAAADELKLDIPDEYFDD